MYELDKEKFGSFVAVRRKEKGLTQKELAERLCITDKAVSKWERGAGFPDISLLIPLAGALDLSVTELLEQRRLDSGDRMDAGQVEDLVKKAIRLSGDGGGRYRQAARKWLLPYLACLLIMGLELLALHLLHFSVELILVFPLLSAFFAAWFCFFVKSRLPGYYDENSISAVYQGSFRMNIPGVSFNNRNWPHVVSAMRRAMLTGMVGCPAAYLLLMLLLPGQAEQYAVFVLLPLFLCLIFLPIYRTAKKFSG